MWQYVPAVLTAIGSISQASSASSQSDNRLAWGRYNAQMQYNTSMGNIKANTMIAGLNFGAAKQVAAMQGQVAAAQFKLAEQSAEMELHKARYNAGLIVNTTQYNNSLLDAEIADVWEEADLDILHLSNQRAREQGALVAQQGASGTVIGEGSNADVIIDSKTQGALDEFVVRRGAADKVNDINNQISKSLYEGQLAIHQLTFEGRLNEFNIMQGARANYMNAQMGAASTLIQGAAQYGSAMIGAAADRQSAQYALQSGMQGAQFDYDTNQNTIRNNLTNGLFSSIGMGVSTYYGTKQPQSTYNFNTYQQPTVTTQNLKTSGNSAKLTSAYRFNSGYQGNYSLATPGQSMFGN